MMENLKKCHFTLRGLFVAPLKTKYVKQLKAKLHRANRSERQKKLIAA